ncbi:hypothetical protein D3C72_2183440 [compost metagenome]
MQIVSIALGGGAHLQGAVAVAVVDAAHGGIDYVSGAGEGFGGKPADAGAGAGDENDGRHGSNPSFEKGL